MGGVEAEPRPRILPDMGGVRERFARSVEVVVMVHYCALVAAGPVRGRPDCAKEALARNQD
jgi:hypothetical protein